MLPPDTDFLEFLLSLPPEGREEAVRRLGFTEAEALDRDWRSWAHDGQRPPSADWSTCVLIGGRGFGKTRAGAEWIVSLVSGQSIDCPHSDSARGQSDRLSPPMRIALVGATLAEARRVMVEGPSGLLEVAGPWIREWRPSLGTLKFRDGSVAQLFSGHSPELLRGPEHDFAWCDELAKWEAGQESWDMLQLGLRRGERPRVLVTTTPRPGPVLRAIMASPATVRIGGPSGANPHNSAAWLRDQRERYAGTRLGRQELDGELLTDSPGALWTVELLERCRAPSSFDRGEWEAPIGAQRRRDAESPGLSPREAAHSPNPGDRSAPPEDGEGPGPSAPLRLCANPDFVRIVIGVDPPTGDGTCGIIACALDAAGLAHVLADHSVAALSPEGWARAVADAARIHATQPSPLAGEGRLAEGERGEGACKQIPVLIAAEDNQGGQMVEAVLRIADPELRIRRVTARTGKAYRAEPVARLFEAGKVVLRGYFPALEAQLLGMIAGGDYEGPGRSPDRADAMVWALTELMLGPVREPRLRVL